jgi:hypothetical protein
VVRLGDEGGDESHSTYQYDGADNKKEHSFIDGS